VSAPPGDQVYERLGTVDAGVGLECVRIPARRFGFNRAEIRRMFGPSLVVSLIWGGVCFLFAVKVMPAAYGGPLNHLIILAIAFGALFVAGEAFEMDVIYVGIRHGDTRAESNVRLTGLFGLCGLVVGAAAGAAYCAWFSPLHYVFGFLPWISDHDLQVMDGLWYVNGTLYVAFPVAAALGGGAWVRFYALRHYLAFRGYLPADLLAFLRYGEDRAVLKRSGDPFCFYHRLLRDHFANKPAAALVRFADRTAEK